LSASHRGGQVSRPDQYMCDLWWTKRRWHQFFLCTLMFSTVYHSTKALQNHISGGCTIDPLVAAVQRHSLTPYIRTTHHVAEILLNCRARHSLYDIKRTRVESRRNLIGKVYSLEYIKIPKVLVMPIQPHVNSIRSLLQYGSRSLLSICIRIFPHVSVAET
jgi:hypothetical protein